MMRNQSSSTRFSPPWAWAWGGGLLGALLALLVFAPAQWFLIPLQHATAQRIQFSGTQGTVWNGSTQITLQGGAGSTDASRLPGTVQWQLRPQWTGLALQIQVNCCMTRPVNLQLQPQWGGAVLRLADHSSQWPANWFVGLGTPWNTIRAQGDLQLETRAFEIRWVSGRTVLAGTVQLDALNIDSRLTTLQPMGSYRLHLQGGDVPTLEVTTLRGDLQITGKGQWSQGKLRFQGEARSSPEREDALSNLLNIVGRRDGARSIITLG